MTNQQPSSSADRQRPVRTWIITIVVFLITSCIVFRDEFRYPKSVPLVSMNVPTVPLFNAWTIGWNADRLSHGLADYWQAPIFAPTANAFAFSEPQPATMLLAPVVWLTGSVVVAYKAWLILSTTLNGVFTALLLRRLNHTWINQVIGGTGVVLLPVIYQRIDVIQLVPVWGAIWLWSALHQLFCHVRLRYAIEAAVAFFACFSLCVHQALLLTLILPIPMLSFGGHLKSVRTLRCVTVAIILSAAFILPLVLPIANAIRTHQFSRTPQLARRLSPNIADYLTTPEYSLVRSQRQGFSWRLNPGWGRLALATLGCFAGLNCRSSRRSWTIFLILATSTAVLLSVAPGIRFGEWSFWKSLREIVPGVAQVRSVFRFAWFVQLGTVLLAVEGVAWMQSRFHKTRDRRTLQRVTAWIVLCLVPALVCSVECLPAQAARAGMTDTVKQPEWIRFLRDKEEENLTVVCFPFASGLGVEDYAATTRWMIHSLNHRARIVNGYSGFFPRHFTEIRSLINKEFPSARCIEALQQRQVAYLIVARSFYTHEKLIAGLGEKSQAIRLELSDPTGIDVYSIESHLKAFADPTLPVEEQARFQSDRAAPSDNSNGSEALPR